ncbi:MAG: extracellular solute-binding protein [Ruminococcus sp.]|jgi:ABC-type glycerol-3-phosphate transport system substrate-binding protein|nr:extracellular solute-binding protein [Ruminococcus sp.]
MKRIFAFFTAVLILCLTACNSEVPAASKDNIFGAVPLIESGDDFDSVLLAVFNGDYFIFTASKMVYDDIDNYQYKTLLISADKNGNIISKKELTDPTEDNGYENTSYNVFYAAGETVYAIKQQSKLVTSADGYPLSEEETTLITIDENLNETELMSINDVLKNVLTESYIYVQSIAADNSGNIYLYTGQSVYGINIASGEIFFTKTPSESGYISGLSRMADGGVGITELKYSESGTESVLTPILGDKTGEPVNIPMMGSMARGKEGSPFEYYYISNSYIYGFNGSADEKTVVVDMLASGVGNININAGMTSENILFYISPTEFAVVGNDSKTQKRGIYLLSKLDPKDVPDRELITVAGLYEDDYIAAFIKEYNQSNLRYQAEYRFYGSGISDNTDELLTGLNIDLVSGKAPDILIVDVNAPFGNYSSKDMFEDLYGYMDNDKDFSKDELLPSMLKALETDGKLYEICQAFSVSTLVGKTEIFGSKPGISLLTMQEKAKQYEGAKLLDSYKMGILFTFLYNSIDNYVDYETGESSFNSPDFIEMLKLADSYPTDLESQSYTNGMQTVPYSKDKTLLDTLYISDFRQAQNTAKAQFDAPITFLGYPNEKGESGILAYPRSGLAIIKGTKNPEAAWDFVKQFIYYKPPYQSGNIIYGNSFSILKSRNEELAAEAMEDPYYIDQNGVKYPTENTVFAAGVSVTMPNNTEEDNKVTYDLLDNISGIARSDQNIWNIVTEDVENFFAGKKSAEETAALIDNRVSTYLAESM